MKTISGIVLMLIVVSFSFSSCKKKNDETPQTGHVNMVSPTGSSVWTMGQSYTIQWTTGDLGGTVTIQLKKGQDVLVTITTSATNNGSYQYTVPTNLTAGTDYRIYVGSNVNTSEYGNSEYFSIQGVDHLNMISPNASSVWTIGQTYTIQWTTGNLGGTVTIQLKKGSSILSTISTTASNNGSYQYTVPTGIAAGTDYRIYVGSNANPSEYGNSEYFSIQGVDHLNMISPNGSSVWTMGQTYTIEWTTGNLGGTVTIQLKKGTSIIATISTIASNNGSYQYTVPTDLTAGTDYRIYVGSNVNTSEYGNSEYFSIIIGTNQTCPGIPTITYEGRIYNTIQIGSQCWLKENLNVGSLINSSQNQNGTNGVKEKYCYNNNESNCDTFGALYQWDEIMQGSTTSGTQGICPTDWHVPTDAEWTQLTNNLGGESTAGGAMKEGGTLHWSAPNTGATNSSGFSALPGGRLETSGFTKQGSMAYFWSSSIYSSDHSFVRYLSSANAQVYRSYNGDPKSYAYSVRCLKN